MQEKTSGKGPLSVSVIGFGQMGAQISQVFAEFGYNVLGYDVDDKRLALGLNLIKSGKYGIENSIKKGRVTEEQAQKMIAGIATTSSLEEALSGSEFVLEAAIEDLDTKKRIFEKAGELSSENAVLATNTSTISISKIAQGISSPEKRKRLAGMHFFNPPQVMKLVEVVRTQDSSEEIIEEIKRISESLGKCPVTVLDYPGFVANRIGISVFAEASSLLEKGIANIRDIDLSMRLGYGYPVGPFELGDIVGLDARLRNMEALYAETNDERFRPPELLRRLVSSGYLGDPRNKPGSKGGYYEYFQLKRPAEKL